MYGTNLELFGKVQEKLSSLTSLISKENLLRGVSQSSKWIWSILSNTKDETNAGIRKVGNGITETPEFFVFEVQSISGEQSFTLGIPLCKSQFLFGAAGDITTDYHMRGLSNSEQDSIFYKIKRLQTLLQRIHNDIHTNSTKIQFETPVRPQRYEHIHEAVPTQDIKGLYTFIREQYQYNIKDFKEDLILLTQLVKDLTGSIQVGNRSTPPDGIHCGTDIMQVGSEVIIYQDIHYIQLFPTEKIIEYIERLRNFGYGAIVNSQHYLLNKDLIHGRNIS